MTYLVRRHNDGKTVYLDEALTEKITQSGQQILLKLIERLIESDVLSSSDIEEILDWDYFVIDK